MSEIDLTYSFEPDVPTLWTHWQAARIMWHRVIECAIGRPITLVEFWYAFLDHASEEALWRYSEELMRGGEARTQIMVALTAAREAKMMENDDGCPNDE